jgi:hypothetical protein
MLITDSSFLNLNNRQGNPLTLKFGRDAFWERRLPFVESKVPPPKRPHLEQLKGSGVSAKQLAKIVSDRAERDFYEPSGRMATAGGVENARKEANRERRLWANHFRNLDLNSIEMRAEHPQSITLRPSSKTSEKHEAKKFRESVIGLSIAGVKEGNAELAQGSADQHSNINPVRKIKYFLNNLTDFNYTSRNKIAPPVIQGFANSGTFTLTHAAHDATAKHWGLKMQSFENRSEGLAVGLPKGQREEEAIKQSLKNELPDLEKALTLAPKMKAKNPNIKKLTLAQLFNRNAELHHALAHYHSTDNLRPGFFKWVRPVFSSYTQKARESTEQALKHLAEIPEKDHTHEHARLAFNLNTKINHLCNDEPHRSTSQEAKNVCGPMGRDAVPSHKKIIANFPDFDPSYGTGDRQR